MATEIHTADVLDLASFALNFYRPGEPIFDWIESGDADSALPDFDGVMGIHLDSTDLRADSAALELFVLAFEAATIAVEYVDQGFNSYAPDRDSLFQLERQQFVEFEVLYLGTGSMSGRIKVILRYLDPRTKSGRNKILAVAVVATSIVALMGIGAPLILAGALYAINELIPQGAPVPQAPQPRSLDTAQLVDHAMTMGDGETSG